MARCPIYLKADDFDALAQSEGVELTDEGVSVLGEAIEELSRMIIRRAQDPQTSQPISGEDIVQGSERLGIMITLSQRSHKVTGVTIAGTTPVKQLITA